MFTPYVDQMREARAMSDQEKRHYEADWILLRTLYRVTNVETLTPADRSDLEDIGDVFRGIAKWYA